MPDLPQLEFLFTMSVLLDAPVSVGKNPHGDRRIFLAKSGEFEGPHFKGKVLPGSGEWLLIRPDGTAELDVRATLQTEDGAAIYTQYRGYLTNIFQVGTPWLAGESVDHEAYRCAVTATFETGARQYEWLHHVVVIGSVKLTQGGISYQFFSVK